jgi:RNA polymerase sigma factor (sigma-70 family)
LNAPATLKAALAGLVCRDRLYGAAGDGGCRVEPQGRQDKTRRLSPEELATLIAAAREGDLSCEEQLQRMCGRFVRQARRRYVLPGDLSEEWIGEVWLILHRLIMEYDPKRGIDFFAYIGAKLPRAIWTWVRQSQRETGREVAISLLSSVENLQEDSEVDRGEATLAQGHLERMGLVGETSVEDTVVLRVEVARALAGLPDRRREVFLRLYEGESHKEIAEALGISEELSKQEAHRARVALQKALLKNDAGVVTGWGAEGITHDW